MKDYDEKVNGVKAKWHKGGRKKKKKKKYGEGVSGIVRQN